MQFYCSNRLLFCISDLSPTPLPTPCSVPTLGTLLNLFTERREVGDCPLSLRPSFILSPSLLSHILYSFLSHSLRPSFIFAPSLLSHILYSFLSNSLRPSFISLCLNFLIFFTMFYLILSVLTFSYSLLFYISFPPSFIYLLSVFTFSNS